MGDLNLRNPNNREDVVLPTRDKTLDWLFVITVVIVAVLLIMSKL